MTAPAADRRTVQLAAQRSTYLIGPVSGVQLAAALVAVLLPMFLLVAPLPGRGWLIVLVWELCAITAVRHRDRNGWRLLAEQWRLARRARPQRAGWHAPSASDVAPAARVPLATRGQPAPATPRPLFAAAPGRLARAQVMTTPAGDVFVLPVPGGQRRAGRATVAWRIGGPPYALLPTADQDMAIAAWAGAVNRLATMPGLVGLTIHQRAETATALDAARSWHAHHASSAVPVAAAAYEELLATVEARDPTSWLAVTFDPRRLPGRLSAVEPLAAEVPAILAGAGMTVLARATALDAVDALLDVARPVDTAPPDPTTIPVRPVFPPYTETVDLMIVDGVHHGALVATTATAAAVDGQVLEPLFRARPGVELTVAVTIRPLDAQQTQARSRARQVKLRRQHAAAQSSSMSGLLIDTHRVESELAALDALGADAVRGSVETELVIMVTITAGSGQAVRAARDALSRDAAPLRFTPVAYPAPVVAFARTPIGGLL